MKRRAGMLLVIPVLAMVFASSAMASWTIQTTPNAGSENELKSVSCVSATSCRAVGNYVSSGSHGLFATWNGTSWISQPWDPNTIRPNDAEDVSCFSTTCVAVGTSTNNPGLEVPSIFWLVGEYWESRELIEEGPYLNTHGKVHGVSCLSTTVCVAVGQYENEGAKTLILRGEFGKEWSNMNAPTPASASEPVLTDISCASATACVAVGKYTSGTTTLTLAERWDGTQWQIVSSPNVSGATVSALADVSCSSSTACTAVGRSVSSGVSHPLVERWNGTSWAIQSAPLSGEQQELSGVSCSSSTACTAVGFYKQGSSQFAMGLSWNGSSWVTQTVVNPTPPAGSTLKASLASVSCTSATVCTAGGTYRYVTNGVPGQSYTLAERES